MIFVLETGGLYIQVVHGAKAALISFFRVHHLQKIETLNMNKYKDNKLPPQSPPKEGILSGQSTFLVEQSSLDVCIVW